MEEQNFFLNAIVYLLAAVISVPVAKRLGFGSVLGYLLAGMIIGPFVLGIIGSEGEDVMHFAEFGVVMMLFLIGLELKPNLLWGMRKSIFGLGGLQLLLSALAIGAVAVMLGQSIGAATAIGLTLGLSSTAIVLQTLAEKGLMKQASGKASFSVLLLQDIAVVPILALIPLLAGSSMAAGQNTHHEVQYIGSVAIDGWVQGALMLAVITAIVVVGLYLVKYLFRIIARTGLREIFTAAALLLVISTAALMELVGLSPALGAFLAGVVMANNEYRHELEADIEPFKGLLLGLFFISVGASMNFSLLGSSPGMILSLLAALIGIKFVVLFILGRVFGIRGGQNTMFAFSLAQGGEFAFVLVSFSADNGVLSSDTSAILFLVVALSMAVTPLLLLLNDKLIMPQVCKTENTREEDAIDDEETPLIIAGFGRFGTVLGRFLISNGLSATILDDNPDNIDVLRKFGFKVYYGDATRADLLASAGADKAKVLIVAVDDRQKSLKIIDLAHRNYPHLKILARAIDMEHSYELMDRRVDGFKRDVFESSLHLGIEALTHLGYTRY
ncbi:MAG: monovalent cation:proton antiporter-2 (CPA2) family protein, partial [Bacteroidota bacterium]|nr:monovalent cation:proton antiporter-2 (CPA2) family protein [Bacteroidota bacterium]